MWKGAHKGLPSAAGARKWMMLPLVVLLMAVSKANTVSSTEAPGVTLCHNNEIMCNDKTACIPEDYFCDGDFDCNDHSDEKYCNSTCTNEWFQCRNDKCIKDTWRCDGVKDCLDGSDEDCGAKHNHYEDNCFDCNDGLKCVDFSLVCNGLADCLDASDENNSCYFSCQRLNCSEFCLPLDETGELACSCRQGYSVQENGTCIDVDECTILKPSGEPSCSQVCENTDGSYKCSCMEQYVLEADQRTCGVQGALPELIISTTEDVRYLTLEEDKVFEIKYFPLKAGHVQDIDVNTRSEHGELFWIDANTKKVMRGQILEQLTSSEVAMNGDLMKPTGLAYSWPLAQLYVVDQGQGQILMWDLQDSQDYVVIKDNLGARMPEDIEVDLDNRCLYWTELAFPVSIMRSNLDGRHSRHLLRDVLQKPRHLTFDYTTQNLYWVDIELDAVYFCNAQDSHPEVQVVLKWEIFKPTAIAILGDKIFWHDQSKNDVVSANKFNGKDFELHVKLHDKPVTGLLMFHSAVKPNFHLDKHGACINHGCNGICTADQVCICPPSMLHFSGHPESSCQWDETAPYLLMGSREIHFAPATTGIHQGFGSYDSSSASMEHIGPIAAMAANPFTREVVVAIVDSRGTARVYRTGNLFHGTSFSVVEGLDEVLDAPQSLAVDWVADQVFWLGTGGKSIEIFNFQGKRSRLDFSKEQHLTSMAISAVEGLLFYGTSGKLMKCNLDGTGCSLLKKMKPEILVSHGDRLYWTDSDFMAVSSISISSTTRGVGPIQVEQIDQHLRVPAQLAVHGDRLFYMVAESSPVNKGNLSINGSAVVHLYDTATHYSSSFGVPGAPDTILSMLHVQRDRPKDLPCSLNNGGCSHICISLPVKQFRCLCAEGFTLADDKKTCQAVDDYCRGPGEVLCLSSQRCLQVTDLCWGKTRCRTPALDVVCQHEGTTECREPNPCQHSCSMTSDGFVCSCDIGYTLDIDGHQCLDIDECSIRNGNCSQLCVNMDGSFACSCHPDYALSIDKVTCHARDRHHTVLLVETDGVVSSLTMDGEELVPLLYPQYSLLSFDGVWCLEHAKVHVVYAELLPANNRSEEESCIHLHNKRTDMKAVSQVKGAITLLRMDRGSGYIYAISVSEGETYLSVFSGEFQHVLKNASDWKPVSLAFHQEMGRMYWYDASRHGIYGADMNGQNISLVVSGVSAISDGLALDSVRSRFYWISVSQTLRTSEIYTSKLDGSDRYRLGLFSNRQFVSVDLFEGFLYLMDNITKTLAKVSTFAARPVLAAVRQFDSGIVGHAAILYTSLKNNTAECSSCQGLCVKRRGGVQCLLLPAPAATQAWRSSVAGTATSVVPVVTRIKVSMSPASAIKNSFTLQNESELLIKTSPRHTGYFFNKTCKDHCLNGGTCFLYKDTIKCQCLDGYSGKHCENANSSSTVHSVSTVPVNLTGVQMDLRDSSSNIGDGLTVFIVIMVLCVLTIIPLAAVCFYRRKKRREHKPSNIPVNFSSDQTKLLRSEEQDACYVQFGLDGELLDHNTSASSSDSAIFSIDGHSWIFHPTGHAHSHENDSRPISRS